jgi:quinol monooxygenase YgiN
MKQFTLLLSMSIGLILSSCNNGPAKEEAKAPDTTAAALTQPAEVKSTFTPFKIVAIQHKVKNFNKAVAGYFSRDSLLKAYGITPYILARDLKDSSQVFVIDKIENMDSAKAFFNNPKVKAVMANAGVSSAPGYSYAEMKRSEESPRKYAEGLSVAHHVKDFDKWLKAYDAEGVAARSANGIIDRGIARDLHDSNTVYIFFEVSDMAKAKTRMSSPELKKIMADAGVDSPPTIRWFKVVQ